MGWIRSYRNANGQAFGPGRYFSEAGQEDYSIKPRFSGRTGLLGVNALLGAHFTNRHPHLVIDNQVDSGPLSLSDPGCSWSLTGVPNHPATLEARSFLREQKHAFIYTNQLPPRAPAPPR
jgi:hypothetical protein